MNGKGGTSRGGRRRRGASVVEFAVVAPVFVLIVMGILEYGRMVMVQQIITNASREGARQAVLDGATVTDVTAAVNTYLSNASVQGANVTVTPNPLTDAAFGDPVTVAVDIPFSQVSWLPSPLYLASTNLRAQTVMRRETLE